MRDPSRRPETLATDAVAGPGRALLLDRVRGASEAEPAAAPSPAGPSLGEIFKGWWPLAASWLFMSLELPALVAVVARMPDAPIHLAAYGGVVFPLALIIESPVIQLLAASTALSRDAASYRSLRRYMTWMGALLTLLHLALALTPLFDLVVRGWLGAPEAIVEPARLGLLIMTPWTWTIAYRRFQQGTLIRFGRSRAVGLGTAVRLTTVGLVLAIGFRMGSLPGIVVGTLAIASGVTMEALYAGLAIRPVRSGPLAAAPPVAEPLRLAPFVAFYLPLVLTSLLVLLAQPIGSAAMSRLPMAVTSLAVWPAITGLGFAMRSFGIAYTEVVVARLDEPGAAPQLRRFAWLLVLASTGFALLLTATPLSTLWLGSVSALPAELVALGRLGLWLILPLPALTVAQSVFQGALVQAKRTRGVTESVALYLAISFVILFGWIRLVEGGGAMAGLAGTSGLFVALAAMTGATAGQTAWLWWRARALDRPRTDPA
ncbi:MAG: hypothetical protein H6648_05345 [Caldilineae bacterium]|nr:hypothetical protein [Caldilineae bacterium]